MKFVEIERKWLMDGFPPLVADGSAMMEQGYLAFEPVTLRIRKILWAGETRCVLTVKGVGTLQRTEVETDIALAKYKALGSLLLAPPARKEYRTYRLPGGEILECSLVDEGEPDSFFYAEVEFDTPEAAAAFVPPPYLGREVTEEPGWTMAAYCRRKMEQ